MAENIEPLDDDLLDTVTGGVGENNPNECNYYVWSGMGPDANCCSSCDNNGTSFCPKNR